MKQIGTIFKFEFFNYVKEKSYIVTTIILMLVVVGVLSWPRISNMIQTGETPSSDPGDATRILLVDESGGKAGDATFYNAAFAQGLEMGGLDVKFEQKDISRSEAEQLVENGEYEEAVILEQPLQYTRFVQTIGMYDSFAEQFNETMLQSYRAQKLAELNVPEGEITQFISAQVQGETKTVASGKDQMQNFFYTYVLVFGLYFAILMYGQFVASSVAVEKSTRAMELLITSAKPTNLMFGKVLGAGIAGLTQLVIILATGYAAYYANLSYFEGNMIVQSIFGMPVHMMWFMLLFFVLGFFLYAFIYAAMASTVSRMEDLSTSIMPATMIFIIAFMIVMFSMSSGSLDSPLMIIASYVPFTSPMAMFARIAMGNVGTLSIILSVVILLASTIGIGILAAAIYRLGVLLYGNKPGLKQVFAMMKAARN